MKRLVIVVVAVAALAAPLLVRAQEATPVGSPTANPLAPAPEDCTVEPISLDRLTPLIATPVPAVEPAASPVGSPTPFAMPEGRQADEATVSAITAAVHEYFACVNAGDYARAFALFSDDLLREYLAGAIAGGSTAQQILDGLPPAQPLPADQRTLIYGIDDVRVLPDGRVAALVIGDDLSKPNPPGPALIYFVEVDGRWLGDGFVSTEEIVTPSP
ncbi:MAG TPA: nuclear transport factor 2 family protein [Thermomicrobiales bacterium]